MTLFIAFLAAVAAYLLVSGLGPRPPKRPRRRRPQPRREPLVLRLRQAGVTISAARYRATIVASAVGVFVVVYGLTGTVGLALIPATAVGFAPRTFYARRRRKALEARMAAWPEAIRDVLSSISVGSTLQRALVALGDTGPEPLRPVWRRFALNAAVLDVAAALEQVRLDLADPVSDRVVETLQAANERGQTVMIDVLRTLADDVAKDLQLNEQIITGQTEVRAQAFVAVLLPFAVLLLLVTTNAGFGRFYRSSAGFVVICVGALMALLGWKLINALGKIPSEPRVLGRPEVSR
ncbi:MAG: type II secretion system F family protein [Ilumatobacteraceae bacterium]